MSTGVTEPGTRVYLWSDRKANAALGLLRGLFDGFWLGVLDDDRLARIDQAYYSGEPIYDSEAYNRSGLVSWERAALETHFTGVRDVVVTSAGSGRELLALAESGYRATGFEPHEELVRFGRTLTTSDGSPLALHVSERDYWPSAACAADGVIVGWGGYMLIRGRDHRVALLRAAADALPDGGPILLSFFCRSGRSRRFRTTKRVADPIRRVLGRNPIDFGDALVPNRAHFFSRGEIERELAAAGFEMVDFGADEYGWAVGRKFVTSCADGERRVEREELRLVEGAVAWRQVEGETVVLDLSESAYLGVNSAGSVLWRELVAGTTAEDLTALLVRTYDVSADRARRDVDAFVAECRGRGYLR